MSFHVLRSSLGEAVTTVTTVQGSDLRKKHGDAFDLCLPHKVPL